MRWPPSLWPSGLLNHKRAQTPRPKPPCKLLKFPRFPIGPPPIWLPRPRPKRPLPCPLGGSPWVRRTSCATCLPCR